MVRCWMLKQRPLSEQLLKQGRNWFLSCVGIHPGPAAVLWKPSIPRSLSLITLIVLGAGGGGTIRRVQGGS